MRLFRKKAFENFEKRAVDVEWVVEEYGSRSAAELEMVSTIVFVDRTSHEQGKSITSEQLVTRVCDVKPRLTTEVVLEEVQGLAEKNVLTAVS